MEVVLKRLEFENFKGIRKFQIDFERNITFIYGENGAGKSSVYDGFCWLLFGKDSKGRHEFNVKTLDEKGLEIPEIEHRVNGYFEIDGFKIKLGRVLKEKWVRKNGSFEKEFKGNCTLFEINDVLVKQGEFVEKINQLFGEEIFSLITSVDRFCSLKWQRQREILSEVAKIGGEKEIAREIGKEKLASLLEKKTAEERLKEIVFSKKSLKSKIEEIKIRIDEIKRGFESSRDYFEIERELYFLKSRKKENLKQKEVKALYQKLEEIRLKHKEKCNEIRFKNQEKQFERRKKEGQIELETREKKHYLSLIQKNILEEEKTLEAIEKGFKKEEFSDFKCSFCGRKWEERELEKRKEIFNRNQQKALKEFESKKQRALEKITEFKEESLKLEREIYQLEREKDTLKSLFIEEKMPILEDEYIVERIKSLEEKAEEVDEREKEKSLEKELEKALIQKKLKEREKALSREIQRLEKDLILIETEEREIREFIERKIKIVGEKINSKFEKVKFKLFERQINGGVSECCVATVDGVPYGDLNTAKKINAGIEILNTLQEHFNIIAPVFVDNKESINSIKSTRGQFIGLCVSLDKELVVGWEDGLQKLFRTA